MKKIITITAIILSFGLAPIVSAQPPHPNGGNNPNSGGTTNTPVGQNSGAPVGSGTFILTLLAASYAGAKTYKYRSEEKQK